MSAQCREWNLQCHISSLSACHIRETGFKQLYHDQADIYSHYKYAGVCFVVSDFHSFITNYSLSSSSFLSYGYSLSSKKCSLLLSFSSISMSSLSLISMSSITPTISPPLHHHQHRDHHNHHYDDHYLLLLLLVLL